MRILKPAEILIPNVKDISTWSVIACDQFTSDMDYWKSVYEKVGDEPSTLNMIIPEAELSHKVPAVESVKINKTMQKYLDDGIFKVYENAFVIVERTLSDGMLRKGIVGMIDLEAYDWQDKCDAAVRATEHTVEDRLPPRVEVRKNALIEMPHIMIFIDDPEDILIGNAEKGEPLYDFELMMGGGHIKGWLAKDPDAVTESFESLSDPKKLEEKYGKAENAVIFAMGDGNHSIAAAKKYWLSVKETVPETEWDKHPARYALVEVINIREESADFKPIHKVIFETEAENFFADAESFLGNDENGDKEIVLVTEKGKKSLKVSGLTIGELIGKCEKFCESYSAVHGGYIDYIHGDDECTGFASKPGCAGILLPKMEKSELFTSVMSSGSFPKKSFSIGNGRDKRYYLECRKIK